MDVIFNDLSLENQFSSFDEFEEYFVSTLCSVLDIITTKHITLYRFATIYERQVVDGESFHGYLSKSRGRTVATKLKSYVVKLLSDPYLDDIAITKDEVLYDYPIVAKEPNSFTEAIERECPILSFKHEDYLEKSYQCNKDEKVVVIPNIVEKNDLLKQLLEYDTNEVAFVWSELQLDKEVVMVKIENRCYAEDALLENHLTKKDISLLTNHLTELIRDKSSGIKTRFWDTISSSGSTSFYEYRMSVSDGREFRLFFLWGEKLEFINGFIKKTQETPATEISLAQSIISRKA